MFLLVPHDCFYGIFLRWAWFLFLGIVLDELVWLLKCHLNTLLSMWTQLLLSASHSRVSWMLEDTDGRQQFDYIYHHVRDFWIDGSDEERDAFFWRQHGFETVLRERQTERDINNSSHGLYYRMSSDLLWPCCSWTLWDIEWSHVDILHQSQHSCETRSERDKSHHCVLEEDFNIICIL